MKKFCECGCGFLVKPGNRFIVGHNNKGKKLNLSEEQIKKKQELAKKNWLNKDIRQKMMSGIKESKNTEKGRKDNRRASKIGNKVIKYKLDNDPYFKEKKRISSSLAAKKLWQTKREHMLKVRKKQWTKQARSNMSNSTKNRFRNPRERELLRHRTITRFLDPKEREKQSKIISQAYIDGKFSMKSRFKTGYINDIFYQSSYERRFIYILEYFFKDRWSRCSLRFPYFDEEIKRIYIPDFLVDDKIIFEVKGWFSDKDKSKMIRATRELSFMVYLIFEEQLKFLENLISLQKPFSFRKLPRIDNGQLILK